MRFTHFPPFLAVLIAIGLVGGGYQWGRFSAAGGGGLSLTGRTDTVAGLDIPLVTEAWNKLHANYLRSLDDSALTEGAVQGLVEAAGDPYTVYLDPQEAKELTEGLQGVFSGIGAEVGFKDKRLVIVAPLPDSPAAKAGLKPLDVIEKIDNQSVADLNLTEAVRLIRGERGTTVTLTITRDGASEPKDIAVVRDQIEVKSVDSQIRPDGVGYIKIAAFHEDTLRLADAVLSDFVAKNVRGIVIDLRGNPGGLLNSGIDVTSLFLAEGTVVKQREKSGAIKAYAVTVTEKVDPSLPIIVLVDGGSASAAEIMAGALQDHKRVKLVGEKTFGKGSVQELEGLDNGGQLKVTVAEWLTPNDRQINGVGIEPDILVLPAPDGQTDGADPQLARAVEEVLKR